MLSSPASSTASRSSDSSQQQISPKAMTNSDENSASSGAGAAAIGAEYASSLADLTVNSKPLINMLTILAEENERYAATIVKAIETHLAEVSSDIKLPVLYLIDSIVKNVKGAYLPLFTQCIVNLFCGVFEKVNERVRANMYKLRQTWNDVFPQIKMYALDCRVNCIDPAWPITAQPPTSSTSATIHVNPNFLRPAAAAAAEDPATMMKQQLMSKQHELLLLERKKLELQLLATRKVIEEQERELKRKSGEVSTNLAPTLEATNKEINTPVVSRAAESRTANQPSSVVVPVIAKSHALSVPVSASSGVRIAPVSSELIQATRRCRDPRLARQLEQQHNSMSNIIPQANINPNNVFDLSVNIFNKSNTNTKPDLSVDYSSKRFAVTGKSGNGKSSKGHLAQSNVVNSKFVGSDTAGERTVRNSNSGSLVNRMTGKTHQQTSQKSANKLQTIQQSSNSGKSNKKNTSLSDKKSLKTQNSNNLVVKCAGGGPKAKDNSGVKDKSSPRKIADGGGSPKKASKSPDAKKINKSPSGKRGYGGGGRRNRANSEEEEAENSAANRDVDLRVLAPPPDKQARLLPPLQPTATTAEVVEQKIIEPTTKDVDLRPTLPVPQAIPSSKKRSSPEKQDQPAAKRSKAETFDVLFGNEDVDLRKHAPSKTESQTASSASFRVNTPPPPPIISKIDDRPSENQENTSPASEASNSSQVKGGSWAKVKVTPTILPATPDKVQKVLEGGTPLSNFEAVRAKLAEATKTRDKLGRPLLFGNKKRERKLFGDADDTANHRLSRPEFETDSQDGMEDNLKIIMSQAQEQINNGSINSTQYNNLLKQLVQINENKKLQEAQRRESLGPRKENSANNECLTPISDDELDMDDDGNANSPKQDFTKHPHPTSNTEPPNNSLSNALMNLQQNNIQNRSALLNMPSMVGAHRRERFNSKQAETRFANRMAGNRDGPPPSTPWNNAQPNWDQNWPRGNANRHALPPPQNMPHRNQPNWNSNAFPVRNATPLRYEMPYVRSKGPLRLGSMNQSLPPPPYQLVNCINRDTMRSINIDGIPREIRYYEDETAVALMNWDDPREIGFQDGSRRICIDDRDSFVMYFNQPYITAMVNGVPHQLRFGSPTRELYIDGKFYECFFGGAPIVVPIDGKICMIKLEGPPPQVKLGKPRVDLVAGKITLIVDAKFSYPIFLDPKPQKVEIDNQTLTIRFADNLRTVLINEMPFQVEFGGLPKSIVLSDRKHFIRFTVLPRGLKPGQVNIRNMGKSNEPYIDTSEIEEVRTMMPPNLPIVDKLTVLPPTDKSGMPIFNVPPPLTTTSADIPRLPELANATPAISAPIIPSTELLPPLTVPPPTVINLDNGYQMEASNSPGQPDDIVSEPISLPTIANPTAPLLPPTINVNDLFEKLVATGILQGVTVAPTAPVIKKDKSKNDEKGTQQLVEKVEEIAKPVLFSKPETLKIRQSVFITNLYKGMQCSSCGTRFPPEQTMKYSQHLDWHFRQNRRDRDSARKPFSRKWYYDVSDWIQYEEIEDLEEREKSWFDTQQLAETSANATNANSNSGDPGQGTSDSEQIPSVPAGPDDKDANCVMCHDRFDQFYHEEKEEWYLKNALRIDSVTYHPVCYEDYKASLESEKMETDTEDTKVILKTDGAEDLAEGKVIELDNEETEDSVIIEANKSEENKEDTNPEKLEENIEKADKPDEENDETAQNKENQDDKEDDLDKSEDDDVHIHEEPVETVILNDDEDEPQFEEIGTLVRIKQEPISDNEDEIDIDIIEEYTPRVADNTQQSVISTIDGNVELEPTPVSGSVVLNKIKINISTANSATNSQSQDTGISVSTEDGEGELSQDGSKGQSIKLKEALRGVELAIQEPVLKGSELSGLCCIM